MPLSLFNVYMDAIMRKLTEGEVGGVMVGSERVIYLDFADDVALLAVTVVVMVGMVMRMEEVTQRFDKNISANKTEILYISKGVGDVRMEDMELTEQRVK